MRCISPILRISAILVKLGIYSLYEAYMCVYRYVYSVYAGYSNASSNESGIS